MSKSVIDKKGYLSTGAVAKRLGVSPTTILRWAKAGKLESSRTAGGHRRFDRAYIEKVLSELEGASDG